MKEKRKFSGEFISEMESLNVLGGTADPADTNIAYKCDTKNSNCAGGNCVAGCACQNACTDACTSTNAGTNCPGPCEGTHQTIDCEKS